MYGIILDSLMDCIKQKYGEQVWKRAIGPCGISNSLFTAHKIYHEELVPNLAKAVAETTGKTFESIMEAAGEHFITYITNIKNDTVTRVLGRRFTDFLNGLNCMHDYYRFSFTEIQPPSFHVSNEDSKGLELHYRSRRTFPGYVYYVKGLLHKIARKFYSIDLNVVVTQHGFSGDVMLAVLRLNFPNEEYLSFRKIIMDNRNFREANNLIMPSNMAFDLFPYHLVFNGSTGLGIDVIYKGLEGRRLNEAFFMTRPLGYELTWENVSMTSYRRHSTNMTATHFVKLRGQMLYVEEMDYVIFLSTVMNDDLNNMYEMGLFVNDLPYHDLSRDMVLHQPQQSSEYKLALDMEQTKATRLEDTIENLISEQRKTDDLIYSMIPKEVACSLKEGGPTDSVCTKYDEVTVLFSDVVNFANICKHIAPHEIMITLNMMVSVFDILCEKYNTYKVETVADGFMCVSGAPTYDDRHARNMADMAIQMLRGIETVRDPNTREPIQIRIGLHCGGVIACVLGHKIPQYCLFGDTVHIASKLEATGSGQRIQISQTCMEKLSECSDYEIEPKGVVKIKGKRSIMTYWLNGRNKAADGTYPAPPIPSCSRNKKIDVKQISHSEIEKTNLDFDGDEVIMIENKEHAVTPKDQVSNKKHGICNKSQSKPE
uniref:guanylate cyclase n=1 Tax=Ciona savignyi TaxID=51511 RepID=H2ZQM8_CIOSA